MIERAVGPTRHEERFAVGMEQDAVRPPPGREALDHHPALRIDDRDGIVIQVAGVQQPPRGVELHVADEVARRGFLSDLKRAALGERAVRERVLEHRRARTAAEVYAVAFGREGQPEPAVRHARASQLLLAGGLEHADRRQAIPAVQHQQVLAVRRKRRRHRKRFDGNLFARGPQHPAAVEQEAAPGRRPHLLARRRLGSEDQGQDNEKNRGSKSHSENLCAMGKRRPMPKAFVVTFRPGAACCRLYSLRSTLLMMSFTNSSATPVSEAISRGLL